MIYEKNTYAGDIEILRNDHFVTMATTLNFAGVTDTKNGEKVVRAGTPIGSNGAVSASSPVGILWKDCYESNPNAAIIIHGTIDKAKAEKASGLTLNVSAIETALPMVHLV